MLNDIHEMLLHEVSSTKRFVAMLCFVLVLSGVLLPAKAGHCAVSEGNIAPNFSLPLLGGGKGSFANYSGKPTVEFFFCGCRWCHDAARQWALAQRKYNGVFHEKTVVVYSGGSDEAKDFLRQTGLDPATTVFLDEYMNVSVTVYGAEPCPRAYVLDRSRRVVYTNDHTDDVPRTISGKDLVGRLVAALQESGAGATTASKTYQKMGDTAPPVFLTVVEGNGVSASATGTAKQAVYHFGTVKQTDTKTIEHVFQFRNDNSAPLVIDHLQPSCGCTNAFIGTSTSFPVTVEPGETINVTAYVDLTDLYPSAVQKSVYIFRADQIEPVATIEIDGELKPGP